MRQLLCCKPHTGAVAPTLPIAAREEFDRTMLMNRSIQLNTHNTRAPFMDVAVNRCLAFVLQYASWPWVPCYHSHLTRGERCGHVAALLRAQTVAGDLVLLINCCRLAYRPAPFE